MDYWNADEMLARFLNAGRKENSGVIALLVCIAGDVPPNIALKVFCGIAAKEYSHRCTTEPLDINKLRLGMEANKITHKKKQKRNRFFFFFNGDPLPVLRFS